MKNSLQKCLVFFILAAFSIFTAGCAQAVQETQDIFSGHEEIKFDLPDWQILKTQLPLLPDLAGWQIEIHSAGKSKKIFIQAEDSAIKIEFEKNKTACLLAYPITIHEESDSQEAKQTFQASFFHPAGAIYPQNKANLTWQQGFAASVLKSLLAHSSDTDSQEFIQLFNWNLLLKKLAEKENLSTEKILKEWNVNPDAASYTTFYNPWMLDTGSIASAIGTKNFTASRLNFPSSKALQSRHEFLASLGGCKKLLSAYIPENYAFGKTGFLSIINKTGASRRLLADSQIAVISVRTSTSIDLSLCAIPHYNRE